ncbi:hypothetical protein CGLAU_09075 [Corynebacterium glaucum]|uniref:Uncharacterized protein n=1 Tax=Corynebacterium glaucum TaxID=187491 RepID=A0A1Q2HY45_9CORY|nr:hypothetical protein [Corynebacterium glaucum]AQQ15768.1 hypothetical protein CGLAU_09075 [Corynebacterium glaucum]
MKRSVAAIVAVGVLALNGCAQTDEVASEITSITDEPQETSSSASPESDFAKVGDTIEVACRYEGCDGEFEIEDITFGGECQDLLDSDEMAGMKLLQVRGVFSATAKIDDATGNEIGVLLDIPETWDADNFKNTVDTVATCLPPQNYEVWNTHARTDEKVRIYGAFWVPENSEVLGIAHSRFDLNAVGEGKAEATTPETMTPAPDAAPVPEQNTLPAPAPAPRPAQPEADPVIGYTEAPGIAQPTVMNKTISYCGEPGLHETGTTFFTDGTSGWTQTCANQMM